MFPPETATMPEGQTGTRVARLTYLVFDSGVRLIILMSKPAPRNWDVITTSSHPHEQRGLEFLWSNLPDHEPYKGWSNFEFTGLDGSQNEVDALVVSKQGLFLLELKAHPGHLVRADQADLQIKTPEGRSVQISHPIRLANLKAKRLKDLLVRQAGSKGREIPFIEPLCFLTNVDGFKPKIPSHLISGLVVADPQHRRAGHEFSEVGEDDWLRPGVMAALLERSAGGLQPDPRGGLIDRPRKKVIDRAMKEMGFRAIQGGRRIGDYSVEETLLETEYFRDVRAKHVSLSSQHRRIRVYFASTQSDAVLARDRVEAAAEREARLLDGLQHDGILRYRELGQQTTEGPSITFDDTHGYQPLTSWIAGRGGPASSEEVRDRLLVLRGLAEAVQYAHGQRVVHRGLSPEAVLVEEAPVGEAPRTLIFNWQSSAREGERETATLAATIHPEAYHAPVMPLYAAPELNRKPGLTDETLDVYALGSLGYLLLTGQAPGSTQESLSDRLLRDRGLLLTDLPLEIEAELRELMLDATRPAPVDRIGSTREFLDGLNGVIATLDADDSIVERIEDAEAGSHLPGDLVVRKRLGKGSSAYGFLVDRPRSDGSLEPLVLKASIDPEHNGRIDREAQSLTDTDHPNIVRLDGAPFDIGASRAFLVKPAGDETLRDRLSSEGPLELEMLERFGRELLEAAEHLETNSIPHRDLKPENIAIVGRESKATLRLVLFDFSLAGVSLDNIHVGTPEYLDPFLIERNPRRWDFAADRYSLGLVLHEMATGTLPVWGDGRVEPLHATGQATIASDLMSESIRERLSRFLSQALQRSPGERWDSVTEMLKAWPDIFRDTQHTLTREVSDSLEELVERIVQLQGVDTSLLDLPLSTRAVTAIDRAGLHTVREFLQRPKNWLLRAKGVGTKIRSELERLREILRRHFPDITVIAGSDPVAPGPASGKATFDAEDPLADLEVAWASLLTGRKKLTEAQLGFVRLYHGLDAITDGVLDPLPTASEVARSLGVTRQRVQQLQEAVRKAWRGHPVVLKLRAELNDSLDRNQGILAMAEASKTLVVSSGGSSATDRDLATARALLVAATDLERREEDARYHLYRRKHRQYIAIGSDPLEYAEDLVHAGERAAQGDTIPGMVKIREILSEVERPPSVPEFPPERLPRFVAAAEPSLGLSRKGELYPVGLAGETAVRLSAETLVRLGSTDPDVPSQQIVSREEMVDCVRKRFPQAEIIEDGGRLQEILNETGWAVGFQPDRDVFVTRSLDAVSVQSPGTRLHRHQTRYATVQLDARRLTDADATQARAFEESIRQVIKDRGFQVLLIEPRYHDRAVDELLARFGSLGLESAIDLDASISRAVDDVLAEKEVDPNRFEHAELAGPGGSDWTRVLQVTDLAIQRVQTTLASDSTPILLTHAGLLGRFQQDGLLERFNAMLTGASSPRACLVLVPADSEATIPTIDGWTVPHLGNQHRPVPLGFLRNLHRASAG